MTSVYKGPTAYPSKQRAPFEWLTQGYFFDVNLLNVSRYEHLLNANTHGVDSRYA